MKRIVSLLTPLLLVGCQGLTPNKVAYIGSDTLYKMAVHVDAAEKRGHITPEEEDNLINQLIAANDLLDDLLVVGQIPGCEDLTDKQQCLQVVLEGVEKKLLEAQK